MSSRGRLFLFIGVILGVGMILWSQTPSLNQAAKKIPRSPAQNAVYNSMSSEAAKTPYSAKPKQKISEAVLQEAQRAGQLDADPAASEERLNKIAKNLKLDEIQSLAEVAKTPSNDGDLRALAVDLLARNESEESLRPLEDIIFSEWNKTSDERLDEFERILRARAVEGVQGNVSDKASAVLAKSSEIVDDEFIRDRSQRALLYRQGKAPKAQDQDEAALRKILER